MAITAKNLCATTMNASSSYTTTTNYTVPSSTTTLLKYITIANTTSTTSKFRLHVVPSGGSPSTANAIYYGTSVTANNRLEWNGVIVMSAGDTIRTACYPAGLNINANGVEIT